MAEAAADTTKRSLTIGPREFVWGERTYLMGVINVSPESFFNDGLGDVDAAFARAKRLVADGVDLLDVGGQSTQPGFEELTAEEEIRRVAPVVEKLAANLPVAVSVDTYKGPVARAALEAGAHLINDIWGFRWDETMAEVAVEFAAPVIMMHNQRDREFHDVIGDVRAGLETSLSIAKDAGVPRERLIIDPGFGFGWTAEQNVEMLRRLGELRDFGLPMLLGTSRKSTIGAMLGGALPEERLLGTAASMALSVASGVDIVRVHDVAEMRDVLRVADAIVRGWKEP